MKLIETNPMRRSILSLSEVKELVRDKDVLLVGNNLTALEIEQGDFIDSYDIIVRFGKGCPTGHEKYLGSRTDIWATGHFRSGARKQFAKDTLVLYNTSTMKPPVKYPDYEYTIMYSLEEINSINSLYNTGDKRLSIGAITAHWFYNIVKEYRTLSFINFDFFHSSTIFRNGKTNTNSISSSWHMPLVHPRYNVKLDAKDHPAHNAVAEKKLFDEILQDSRSIFLGKIPTTHQLIKVNNAAWDSTRQKIEE